MQEHIERRKLGANDGTPAGLLELMEDGFHLLFLLQDGQAPQDQASLVERITAFLGEVERAARQRGIAAGDVQAASYAFCAAVDETILRSGFRLRDAWETQPLQLRIFGDQLAGEHFFTRLDALRARGQTHLAALEVFHLCLLLGFQGRHALRDQDKLAYLTARLGDDIALMRGRRREFAPHAARPDQISNRLGGELPPWLLAAAFAVMGLAAYLGYRTSLGNASELAMAGYTELVKLPPRAAHVSISID